MSTSRQIFLASPYSLKSPRGNSVSANRILGILEECGYSVTAVSGRSGIQSSGDALIALHARKSAPAIESFHATSPERPVMLLLTGSDLYADLHGSSEDQATVHRTMEIARYLIVSQGSSIADIPESYRDKARVIPKSLLAPVPERRPRNASAPFRIVLPSHLRPAKAPLLILEALAHLPNAMPLQVDHYGAAEDPDLGQAAKAASLEPGSRYHWHDNVPHSDVLASFATSDLLLNTSRVEGGANVLCEAIQMGLPCMATNIPPNVGMLGDDYPGLFPMDDANALANLLDRSMSDANFLHQLTEAVIARAPLFTREAESKAWKAILDQSLLT